MVIYVSTSSLTVFQLTKYTLSVDQSQIRQEYVTTRMWANAQRNGRPADYRWRRLFNAANFG